MFENDFEISDETLKFLHKGSVSEEPEVSTPMFSWKNDSDTGMYSTAANQFTFTISNGSSSISSGSSSINWFVIDDVDDVNNNLCAKTTMDFLSMKEKFFREKFDTRPNSQLLATPRDLAIQQLMQKF